MQRVLVLDQNKKPLMPCHPARARQLLTQGKAAVFRQYPFTIILKERDGGDVQPLTVKIDPGSKTTGIVVVADFKRGKRVIWAGELTHRGQQIRDKLLVHRQLRRGRRTRKTRYKEGRVHFGFQTGDMVRTMVRKGKKIGTYIGRISVRASGYFNITTPTRTVEGISHRYCTPIHNSDGYLYEKGEALSSATTRVAVSSRQKS